MEEKELNEFSWSTLFLVTGVSLILFSFILKLLDGSHSRLMLLCGSVSLGLFALACVFSILRKPDLPRKNNKLASR